MAWICRGTNLRSVYILEIPMSGNKSRVFVAKILLVFVAFVWGVTFLPVAKSVESVGVFSFLFWRFLVASLCMFLAVVFVVFFSFVKRAGVFDLKSKFDTKSILLGGFVGCFLFLGYAFQTFALKFSASSVVAFITGFNVILVPFLLFFSGKKLGFFEVLAGVLALFGLYFLSGVGFGEVSVGATGGAVNSNFDTNGGFFGRFFSSIKGEFLAFLCAVSFSLHIIFTGVFAKKVKAECFCVAQFALVAVFCFLGSFFMPKGAHAVVANLEFVATPLFLASVLLCAVVATVVAFFVQTWAQNFVPASQTAVIFITEPIFALAVGVWFGGEKFSLLQLAGCALILAGVFFSEKK